MKKNNHYIDNKKFLNELIEYKIKVKEAESTGKDKPPIPNYIGECFLKIAKNLSHKPNFINYTYRDEMISDGIENCLMYFENFDPEKSDNPFAYFTQIIYYAFLRRIFKEKKQLYIKYKATESFGLIDEIDEMEGLDLNNKQIDMYDNIAEFIETYENLKKKKKVDDVIKPKGIENFLE